jgi:hypothetical protein
MGAIAAVLTALIGIPASWFSAANSYGTKVEAFKNAKCVADVLSPHDSWHRYAFDPYADGRPGCSEDGLYGKTTEEIRSIASGPAPSPLDGAQPLGIGLIISQALRPSGHRFLRWILGHRLALRWLHAGPFVVARGFRHH